MTENIPARTVIYIALYHTVPSDISLFIYANSFGDWKWFGLSKSAGSGFILSCHCFIRFQSITLVAAVATVFDFLLVFYHFFVCVPVLRTTRASAYGPEYIELLLVTLLGNGHIHFLAVNSNIKLFKFSLDNLRPYRL